MEQPSHELKTLFDQLGLPSDDKAIDDFIIAHPLAPEIKLVEADFWSDQQKKTCSGNGCSPTAKRRCWWIS
nr:hypothetical protein GCM10020185_68440 [Pseudomonas brassicacearum subsp. brassicacearum]